MARKVIREGRTIPSWERSMSSVAIALGLVTIVLAIGTVALALYAKFGHPSVAGAILGPGVGALVTFLAWGVTWSLLQVWRQDDREFYDRLNGRPNSDDGNR